VSPLFDARRNPCRASTHRFIETKIMFDYAKMHVNYSCEHKPRKHPKKPGGKEAGAKSVYQ